MEQQQRFNLEKSYMAYTPWKDRLVLWAIA